MNKHVYTDLLKHAVLKYRDKACCHIKRDGNYITRTYGDFHRDLNRLVFRLNQAGFSKGMNGIVIGENSPEWVISYFSLVLAGGLVVPVDPNLPSNEIRDIVKTVKPSIVFVSELFLELFQGLQSEVQSFTAIVVLPGLNDAKTPLSFENFIKDTSFNQDAFSKPFSPDDPVAILFTSGTTGAPKGAVLLQKNFTAASVYGVPRMKVDENTRVLALLPLHHVFGFAACVTVALSTGMEILFMPVIKGPLIVEALREKRISFLPAVPQMLELFYANIERNVAAKGALVGLLFRLLRFISRVLGPILGVRFRKRLFKTVHDGFGGNLDLIISGGSSLKKKYFNGYREMGFNIMEGYGLTETFGPITVCPVDDPRLGSVGTVLPDNEMRILNPDKEGRGEVLFRGTTVFSGYYRNEEATKKVFDNEGFFHTGDLGYVTSDGFLYLTGRAKDVIVLSSGKNVYPDELEAFYSTSPLIEEIGVCGVKTEQGETAVAVIVPAKEIRKRNRPEEAKALLWTGLKTLDKHLPTYKKVTDLVISYQPLPRTTTQKIKKPDLLKIIESSGNPEVKKQAIPVRLTMAEEALMKTEDYQVIDKFLRGNSRKETRITPRSHLELDLMMDSLRKIDLFSFLEKTYSIEIPSDEMLKLETVKEVVLWLSETRKNPGKPGANFSKPSSAPATVYPDNKSPVLFAAPPVITGLSRLLYKLEVKGLENLPAQTPVIFCSNHASHLDAVWINGALPWSLRRKTFSLGKIELLNNPWLRFLLRRSNMVAVEREGDVLSSLQAAESLLHQGKNLIIFPEGTRSLDGSLGRFRSGIGMLAQKTGAPVVPVKISGSFAIWPAGKPPRIFFARKPGAKLVFGRPITAGQLPPRTQMTEMEKAEKIASEIYGAVDSMR